MDADVFKKIVHNKVLDARNLDRTVQSDIFSEAWKKATKKEKRRIVFLIRKLKDQQLKNLINEIAYSGLEGKTVVQLRWLASQRQIKNYSRLSKEELKRELEKKGDRSPTNYNDFVRLHEENFGSGRNTKTPDKCEKRESQS